ncbi:MAG: amino acid ABC transporter permease [Clostridia bacterium]|nr:amino acid ABC transporter permease [Clostridia bacterium]
MDNIMDWFSDLKADFILNFIEQDRWKFITTGLKNTLLITFFSLILGVALGVIVAIVRSSYDKTHNDMRKGFKKTMFSILNGICKLYLTIIRGTPVVVQLMIMYYIIFASSRNSLLVAILAFGINSGAYVAEIVRSGIMSIDEGQFEAGRSLGFDYKSTMWHIIIPQAFKNVLPALANEFIVLLKETSVAGYVTIRDLTMGGNIIRAATYSPFMPLIAVALIYLIMVVFFTWLVGKLERRLRKNER